MSADVLVGAAVGGLVGLLVFIVVEAIAYIEEGDTFVPETVSEQAQKVRKDEGSQRRPSTRTLRVMACRSARTMRTTSSTISRV